MADVHLRLATSSLREFAGEDLHLGEEVAQVLGVVPAAPAARGGLDLRHVEFRFGQDLAGKPVEVGAQAGGLDGGAGLAEALGELRRRGTVRPRRAR